MEVKQIYEILSDIVGEYTGQTDLVKEDLSNIVDVGQTILTDYKEKYVNSLPNRIGRMIFVDRPYSGFAPRVQRDAWEWGSIVTKTRVKDFEPEENPTWSLTSGQTVNQFEYNPPTAMTTLYNNMITWEIDCSFVDRQLYQSFTSLAELNRFFSTIESTIRNSQTMYIDALIMRTINNFIGEKINGNNGVVDLLASYNAAFGTTLTAAQAVTNKDFLRHAAYTILLYKDRLKAKSTLFNMNPNDGYSTFTPADRLHLVLLSDIAKAIDVYLQSETFHNDFVEIGYYDTVPYWQGTGTAYNITDTSEINIALASNSKTTVNRNYIVGVMFDYDALGIFNENRRVTTAYNAKGEYWNNFYKVDTRYFNDVAENGIVFTIGTGVITPPTPSE